MYDHSSKTIVLVHDDKSTFLNKGRFPIQSIEHRIHNLKLSGYANVVCQVRAADPSRKLEQLIEIFKPVIYVRGDDWKNFPGKKVVWENSVLINYIPYTKGISTSEIRKSIGV
jgi:bifunctional ADP-heptose synthase (sugar kinase/adenylyltransferase)